MLKSLESPLLAILVGTVLTGIIQSSSVTVSIVLLMCSQGLLELPICLFIILGYNSLFYPRPESKDKSASQFPRKKAVISLPGKYYRVTINQTTLPIEDLKSLGALFHVVNDIERIGDHAENVADAAKRREEMNVTFSKDATKELGEIGLPYVPLLLKH